MSTKRSSTPDSGCPRFNVFSKKLSYVLLAPRIATWQLPDESADDVEHLANEQPRIGIFNVEKIAAVQRSDPLRGFSLFRY